jgi:curved DNA-binding protein CbpA
MSKFGTDEDPIDKSYYELFDISPTADAIQIKKAYRYL